MTQRDRSHQPARLESRRTLEQLRLTQAALRRKHQELKIAHQRIAQEQRQRQALNAQITELTATHQALQSERDQYWALFNYALEAIAIANDQGQYVDVNPAACELFGLPRNELLQSSIADFADPTLDVTQMWQLFLQQGQMAGEFRLYRPDGTTRETDFNAIANFVPGLHLSILRDVSEQKRLIAERQQAERSLQQREDFLSSIYNGADQAIFVIEVINGREFRYLAFNHQSERFARLDQQAVCGKTPEAAFGPVVGARFQQNYERCVRAGTSISYEEHLSLETHTFWTLTTLAPLRNDQGEIYRLVGTAIDITNRKQAEFTLQQQIRQEYLLSDIAQDIRCSLRLDKVLQRTVERVRHFLNTDRTIIFRFRSDWQGEVITESVGAEWDSLQSTLISDPCFRESYIYPYRQGRISTVSDVDEEPLAPCYADLLRHFQVRANLVVPILQGENLWGLLIAHHCSGPRLWDLGEIALLKRLAIQVSIAIQQSELYEQTRHELAERERIQTSLEESEERFRSLSAAAPIGICQTNADGICLYTNARWQEMSGLSFTDSLGNGWLQVIHPDDRRAFQAAWESYLQREQADLPEFRLVTPRGTVRWVSARAATMRSAMGQIIGYVCTSEDITKRKLTEQTIREQATLLDIASDAIFVCDLSHRVLYWNQGAERLYGWLATEAIGQPANDLIHNQDAAIAERMHHLLHQGEWRGELQTRTKTGQTLTVEARWTLVRDERGEPQCILAVDTDITGKKQLEAQFYRAQRLESLGTLASGIAHDLNNILTPILSIAQLLRVRQPDLEARSQQLLGVLEDSAKRGAEMIKQILTFARGTSGDRRPVQVSALLEDVIAIVHQTFPKSIRLEQQFTDPDACLVSADSTYLHQVFMNLCVNARDAMPEGGTLSFSVAPYLIDTSFTQTTLGVQVGSYVRVTIADTGMGIPPEVRDRIFEPFFTTKELGQGTGLGLSTVLGIVKNYGGFLQVQSEVGQGTRMQVYLPAIATPLTPGNQADMQFDGQGRLILLVDDDLAVQCTTQLMLETHNYRVLATQDGVTAIGLFEQYQAELHCIILDIMMPGMGGLSLIQQLRAINSRMPILAMSGLPGNQAAAMAAGATAFVLKPYTLQHLLTLVHDLDLPS